MTRDEQVAFCRKCTNRKFDPEKGIICRLTDEKADFQDECPDFEKDEFVKDKHHEPERQLEGHEVIEQLSHETVDALRQYQDFSSAIIGGLLLTLIGAVIWAAISVVTGYQIGYVAIGIGFLVGFGVRYFGAGVDPKFGILAGVLSVVSCLVGNIFTQIAFAADAEGLSYIQTLGMIDFTVLPDIILETFSPIDILFYAIAVGAAYKYAFRMVSPEELQLMHEQNIDPIPPGYNIRKPVVIVASIVLVGFVFLTNQSASGMVSFTYEDGSRQSEGNLVNGKEDGEWTYWYPSGKVQAMVGYIEGVPHGMWTINYESGQKLSEGNYEYGSKDGVWMTYYPEGPVQDSGQYVLGREQGKWSYYLLNGQQSETGSFVGGRKEGTWRIYHENGQLASEINMRADEPLTSNSWYEDGSPASEIEIKDGKALLINSWEKTGNQNIKNGNGTLEEFYPTGELMGRTTYKNGLRTGAYQGFHPDGSKEQVGEYIDDLYHCQSVWKPDGTIVVENGNGHYERFYNMGLVTEIEGDIKDGLKEGSWYAYSEAGILQTTVTWAKGKETGPYQQNFPDGTVRIEGTQVDGKPEGEAVWYYEDGTIETILNFVNGKKEGVQTFYGSYNNVIREETYKNGELIEAKVVK